jgi:tRNA G37 N-methylase Trm5
MGYWSVAKSCWFIITTVLQILEALLPRDMIIPSAFETVGHIAHLNLRDEHLPYKKLIAKVHSRNF